MKKPKNFLFWVGCFASILFLTIPLLLHFFPGFESCISLFLRPLKSVEYKTTYIETVKSRVNALSAVEHEAEITADRYAELLTSADPTRHTIVKTRYRIPVGARVAEIDVYPFWQDRAVLEIELADEQETVWLPPFAKVIREVTADFRYKNVNLAKSVPNDDIF